MLTTLNLKDFVIVDQLSLDLSTGFTVLTGETGAGKSILIDAIQLIRGARADADMVRKGAERANIIAEFMPSKEALRWLETNDLQDSSASTVLVRRSIDKNGRSRAWINGITVTLSQLKELGDTLVDIQGQHAHQLLLKTQNQLKLLDAYAENTAQLEAVKKAFATWNTKAKRLEEASSSAEVRTAKIEQLTWLLEDLSTLAPKRASGSRLTKNILDFPTVFLLLKVSLRLLIGLPKVKIRRLIWFHVRNLVLMICLITTNVSKVSVKL